MKMNFADRLLKFWHLQVAFSISCSLLGLVDPLLLFTKTKESFSFILLLCNKMVSYNLPCS